MASAKHVEAAYNLNSRHSNTKNRQKLLLSRQTATLQQSKLLNASNTHIADHDSSSALQYVHRVALRHHFQRVGCCQITELLQSGHYLCEGWSVLWIAAHAQHAQILHEAFLLRSEVPGRATCSSATVTFSGLLSTELHKYNVWVCSSLDSPKNKSNMKHRCPKPSMF